MQVNKGLLAAGAGVIVVLLVAVAYLLGAKSQSRAIPTNQTQVQPESAAAPAVEKPFQQAPAETAAGQPINACYHLDSCNYWKVINVTTIKQENGSRLLKATLQPGEVKNPAGTPEDDKHVVWSGARKTFYAYCSTTVPRIAWQDGGKYVVEEFDFGGDGVSGVEQDDANIYQALCHGFYNNELADKAAALGYKPLPDGGRGQFEISSPDQLASAQ